MTGNDVPTHGGLPPGPPWPLDLLADLHAGLLDPQDADELRDRVESDPDALVALAALDATRRSLAELPRPRMPEDVAARLDAAIASEVAARAGSAAGSGPAAGSAGATTPSPPNQSTPTPAHAPVVDFAAERTRRRRGLVAGTGFVTAAAAAVAVFAVVNLTGNITDGQPNAGSTPSAPAVGPGPLALTSGNLGDALDDALGATDYGPLGNTSRLDGCLRANGVGQGDADPVGAREVTLDGKPGVLVVLPAGSNPPKWRLLVVGPECGPGEPATLADTTVG